VGEEDIEELLASEAFRDQDIELPYGLGTGDHDRTATAAQSSKYAQGPDNEAQALQKRVKSDE
jgi:hypothetical protein